MDAGYQKRMDSGSRTDGNVVEKNRKARAEDACRCEETSKMTAGELLKLMMSDLAFWKKTKKE